MKLKKYNEFINESKGVDALIDKTFDPEYVEDHNLSLSDMVGLIFDEYNEDGQYDDDEIENAIKKWAKKHKITIKESLNENSKGEKRNNIALEFLTWLPESKFQITAKGEYSLEIQGRHTWNIRIRANSIVVKGPKNFEITADDFTTIELVSDIILYVNEKYGR